MNRKLILFFNAIILLATCSIIAEESKDQPEKAQKYPSSLQQVLSDKNDISRWKTDEGLAKLLPLPKEAGNAAEDYVKLHSLFQEEKGKSFKIDITKTKGINAILRGAKKKKCSFVPEVFKPMTDFKPEAPDVVVFQAYNDALIRKAEELEKESKFKESEEMFQAAVVLGWHLTEDRPNLLTYFLGLTIQEIACTSYAKFLERGLEGSKARMMKKYADELVETMKKVRLKSRRILSSWLEFSSLAACEKSALQDKDIVWRQEAILSLGVMQNGFPDASGKFLKNPYQQEIARKILEKVAASAPSPSIKKLAKWTLQNMTEEKIMQIRKNTR